MSSRVYELVMAASMTVGRGRLARAVADIADLQASDRVVDIGCGPGTAVREAARAGAAATGVDPSPLMLRLARWITSVRRMGHVGWLEGGAERLPVPDGQATVVWAIASFHHWSDRAAGLSEARRVLASAGRLIVADWLVKPDARGHSAHGITSDQAGDLPGRLSGTGFHDARVSTRRVGRRTLLITEAVKAPA
ncbi:MAG TPA: class I SAM-dependent methyltransferase [Streptosporangiaceae bacterium]|nr:class I SAM-dependent methyltransferase [Streptosporangiaceae bacterium]